MFYKDNQIMCWFDSTIQAHALGVPDGELDELMLKVSGPVAITERAYASAGQVKAVVIKHWP